MADDNPFAAPAEANPFGAPGPAGKAEAIAMFKGPEWGRIQNLSDELRADFDVVMAAVTSGKFGGFVGASGSFNASNSALKFASPELQNNLDVVMTAVKHSSNQLEYASPELQNRSDVVMAAITTKAIDESHPYRFCSWRGEHLKFAGEIPRNDPEVVKAAVITGGWHTLEHASDNPEVWLALVEIIPTCSHVAFEALCKFASDAVKSNFEVVSAFLNSVKMTQNPDILLSFTSDNAEANKMVMLAAIAVDSSSFLSTFKDASVDLRSDKDVVLAAMGKNENSAASISDGGKADKTLMIAVVTFCGSALEHASKALQNEKEVVLAAVTQNGTALRYASQEMKSDKHVVHAAMRQQFSALSFASDALLKDVEFVCLLVKDNFEAVKYALGLLVDSKIVFEAAKQSIIASFRSASEAASWSEKLDPLFNAYAYADPLFTTCGKIKGIEAAIESQLRGDGGGDGGTAPALPGASLWDTADKDANNLMSANVAAALLSSSGLQQMVLRTVWRDAKKDAAVKSSPGTMNKEEFEAAVSLAVTAGGVFAVAAPAHALKARFNALLADPNVADAAKSATLTIFSKVDFFDDREFSDIMANRVRPSYLRADKDLALLSLSKQLYYASEHFETFPAEFLADRDFMLAACKIHGGSIGHAGAEYLPADSFVVIKKLVPPGQVDPVTFHFQSFGDEEEETTGENFAEQGFPELTAAQAAFANDKEMLMATFEASSHHHECSLQYASDELKDDKEVVLAAVSSSIASFGGNNDGQYNGSLSHASDNLKNDEAVVLAAISQSEKALDHASELLKVDKDFLCKASKVNWKVLKVVGSETTRNACLFQLYPVGEATAIAEAGKATHAADVAQIVQRWEQHVAKKADLETQESASGSHAAELDKMKADYDAAKAAKDWKGAKALKIALDAATLGASSSNSGSDGAAAASPKDKSPQDIIKESTTKASERTAYNAKWVVKKAAAQITGQRDALCSKEDNQHLYCIPLLAAAYSQMEDERGEADDLEAAEAYGEAAAAATELAKNLDELFPGKTNAIWGPLKVD